MPKIAVRTSLLISSYNWPEALSLCLESVLNQSVLPGEIVIADDGSRDETAQVVRNYQGIFNIPLIHVWHEDKGFRLAEIRNKAIMATSGEYIIQIDGDLILHSDFVKDHKQLATPGYFVSGSRLLLSERFSERLLQTQKIPGFFKMMFNGKNRINAVRIPFVTGLIAGSYKKKQPYYVKGCNMAFWRNDLFSVNGYNEKIAGWGKEDSEIAVRLINNGVKRHFIKFSGICYHLHHKEASRSNEAENNIYLDKAIFEKQTKSPQGLDSHPNYSG